MPAPDSTLLLLIVEDDLVVLHLCQRVLEREGYRVLAASDGYEALQLAPLPAEISLALVDVVLPKMSGSSLVDRLRGGGMAGAVMWMSGYPFGELPVLTEREWFLPKPFTPRQLIEAVEEALKKRGVDP
ncbi:MAG TPA: response regulator [Candidatus Sulfopaludibacter sp.]|nr:response regulator [Candidatus Sulfopaludibacter sp.]